MSHDHIGLVDFVHHVNELIRVDERGDDGFALEFAVR